MYNDLDIGHDSVVVKWIGDNCSTVFEVQGYTFDDLENANYSSPENVIRGDSDTAEIPRSQLTTTAGESIYYRLVAVLDNGTICSHDGTKNTFYKFDGMYVCTCMRAFTYALFCCAGMEKKTGHRTACRLKHLL